MLDPLSLLNEKNYTKISMKQHTVKFCLPDLNQAFTNKVLGVSFRTTKEKPFVIDYADGDYRPIAYEELYHNYFLTNSVPLTRVAISKLQQAGGSLIDWTAIKTNPKGASRTVLACRIACGESFPYKIGSTLVYINDKSVQHDKGDVCIAVKGNTGLVITDIINGETFKCLFDNRTPIKCLGEVSAMPKQSAPVSLVKQEVTPVYSVESMGSIQGSWDTVSLNEIERQATKAAFVLREASCFQGKVQKPALEVLQYYPKYREKIASLWRYVAEFIQLLDCSFKGFCGKPTREVPWDLKIVQVSCREVRLNAITYGIELLLNCPLNLYALYPKREGRVEETTEFVWRFMFTISDIPVPDDRIRDYTFHFGIESKDIKISCAFKSEFVICGEHELTDRRLLADLFLYLPWYNLFNPELETAVYPPVEQIHEAVRLMTVTLIDKREEYEKLRAQQLMLENRERRRQEWEQRKTKIKSLFRGSKDSQPEVAISGVTVNIIQDIMDTIQELDTMMSRSNHLSGGIEAGNPKMFVTMQKDLSAIFDLWIYLMSFVTLLDRSFDKPESNFGVSEEQQEEQRLLNSVISAITISDYVLNNQYGVFVQLTCNLSRVANASGSFRMEFNFVLEKGRNGISRLPYYRIKNSTPPIFMTAEVLPIVSGEAISMVGSEIWGSEYSPYGELSSIEWEKLSVSKSASDMQIAVGVFRRLILNIIKHYKVIRLQSFNLIQKGDK